MAFIPRWLRVVVAVALTLDLLILCGDVILYLNRHGSINLPSGFDAVLASTEDGSIGELYGHLQLLAAVVPLVLVWRATRVGVYAAWALIFTFLVVDDFFLIHEQVGKFLVATFSLPAVAGLRAQDLGELLVWAAAGVILAALLVVTHLRASPRYRNDSWLLAVATFILAFFAVALDMAAVIVKHLTGRGTLASSINFVEAAGELVAMTLIFFVAVTIWARQRSDP